MSSPFFPCHFSSNRVQYLRSSLERNALMKTKHLFLIWGFLYILCALLGFIPAGNSVVKVLFILAAAIFFVPGWILLYRGQQSHDLPLLRTIRALCLISLISTFLFLVLFFMSAGQETVVSTLLYGFLTFFSAPMICSQYWIASLFLWACLLMTSFRAIKLSKKALSQ